MGCWNETCGISQLPITAGSKVKAFLLLQSEYCSDIKGSGTCYPSDYFRPWFFPIDAEYDDYGSIENIQDDWNSRYLFQTFQRWLEEGEVNILGENAEINSPNVEKFDTFEDLFRCVERGALVTKHQGQQFDHSKGCFIPKSGFQKIALFMVLPSIFETLVVEGNRWAKLPENQYITQWENEKTELAINSIKELRSKNKQLKNELHSLLWDRSVDRLLGDSASEHFNFSHYKSILSDPNSVSIKNFLDKLDEVKSICTSMNFLRKMWFPQSGRGSQSEELSFNKALIDGMNKHILKRESELES